MLKIRENCHTDSVSNENAVVLCNDRIIMQSKTFKEVLDMSKIVKEIISKYIADGHICLGLLMNHNVYIPSIILSLMELKHAFMFLTAKTLHKCLDSLNLHWVLSLDDVKEIELFNDVHKFKVDMGNNLILWRRHLLVSTEYNYLNIFCVVQSSGTTGDSKMIRVPNSCIESNVVDLTKKFQLNFKDIIYWGTPLSFDPSLIELLLALYSKACLVIVPYNISINPNKLYKVLTNIGKVTFLQMVPSVFLRWNETQIKNILSSAELRILGFGGEGFPNGILAFERRNTLRIFNLYGITEVSCWASLHEIQNENCGDRIPIGENLDETTLELRDEEGNVVKQGKGEIFIGSSSRICYMDDEVQGQKQEIVFRESGDIAEMSEKGIFLIGRKNKIIKRFGHRVNLSRIEFNVFKETGLLNKCVWSSEKHEILLFILIKDINKQLKEKTIDKLRVKLINILPKEHFPDFIEILENFPLTCHGKVDEKSLVKLYSTPKINLNIVDTFSQIWCKHCGYSSESLDQIKSYKFFELGGNSVSALQLIAEFKGSLNCECPEQLVTMIFENCLEDCLKCLENIKPTQKKRINDMVSEIIEKKSRVGGLLKILWSYDLRACVDATPLVFEKGSSIFVSCGSFSRVLAVLNENGDSTFKQILGDSIESTPIMSPCGNLLLVGAFNGAMYCIDYTKSEIIWEFLTGSQIKSSACLCRNQLAVVFGSYDKTIYCVSLEDGLELWQTVLDGSIAASPVYDNITKTIFTATTVGTCFCLNENSGKVLWTYRCGGPVFGSPCLVQSNNYIVFPIVQGTLHCLSTIDGKLLWKFNANGYIFSSVISYREYLLFGCHDSNVYILKHTVSGCTLVVTIPLGSEISSTPFVCNIQGREVIVSACNSGVITVVDFKTYCILYSIELPGQVFSSPVVYNNKIYVGCRDNNLYCLETNDEK